jgi:hypothetical protein
MVLVEEVSCENKKQLHKIEREYIEKLGATLNNRIPNRSGIEYKKDNKDKIKERKKKYYENNIEKFREVNKEYRKLRTTCICGTYINLSNKSRHLKSKKHRKLIAKIKKPLHTELLKILKKNN